MVQYRTVLFGFLLTLPALSVDLANAKTAGFTEFSKIMAGEYYLVALRSPDHRFDLLGTWSGHYECNTGEKTTSYEFTESNKSIEAREKFRSFFGIPKSVGYTLKAENSNTFLLSTDAFGGYKIRITLTSNGRQIQGRYIGHPECQTLSLERDI